MSEVLEYKPYYEKTFDRHVDDLERVKKGIAPHLRFNEPLGEYYIQIIESLSHYKGRLAGKKLLLEEWQKKLIIIWAGWERQNDRGEWVRRFSEGFIYIPRKNGKTILSEGITIADMIARPEMGGETYYFATKEDQAKIGWSGVKKMVEQHKELRRYFKTVGNTIHFSKTDSIIKPLGKNSNTLDGLNSSGGICDEKHAHPDNAIYDVVKDSQASRSGPFMLTITTGGFLINGVAHQDYKYSKKILDGVIEKDTYFAFIAEPMKKPKGESDEWYLQEAHYKAANPNYGISLEIDKFLEAAATARDRPEKMSNFLTKSMNVWQSNTEEYISFQDWESCEDQDVDLSGWEKVVGIDLSETRDITSRAEVYKKGDRYHAKTHHYIPSEQVKTREKQYGIQIYSFIKEGWVTATTGATIDYAYISDDIGHGLSDTEAVCYDPWKAKLVINRLESGGYDSCIPVRQGHMTLSQPTNFLADLIADGNFTHDGNPVTAWMVSNVELVRDNNGNVKPDKSDPNSKIDGIAAIINCLAYYEVLRKPDKKTESRIRTLG